jgi:hypothetical protein
LAGSGLKMFSFLTGTRSATSLVAIALIMLFPHLSIWAQDLTRTMASVPSIAFAPPGTIQQMAVLYDALARRMRQS